MRPLARDNRRKFRDVQYYSHFSDDAFTAAGLASGNSGLAMTQYATTPHILYDHVLDEIEAGRDAAAILLLAGMLDAAATEAVRAEHWRSALLEHPLYKFITKRSVQDGAMAQLGFSRGLMARVELGRNAIEAAWKRGRDILLFQCGDAGELDGLHDHERGNIEIETRDIATAATNHDLILASNIADQLSHDQLSELIAQARKRLNPDGALILSSFVPGHIGGGLRQICTGQILHCHDENALAEAATTAGFSISNFRDASNCLIWAQLRVATKSLPAQGDRK